MYKWKLLHRIYLLKLYTTQYDNAQRVKKADKQLRLVYWLHTVNNLMNNQNTSDRRNDKHERSESG